jgi:hypothetical protein
MLGDERNVETVSTRDESRRQINLIGRIDVGSALSEGEEKWCVVVEEKKCVVSCQIN